MMKISKWFFCTLCVFAIGLILAPATYCQLPAFDDTAVVKIYVYEDIIKVNTSENGAFYMAVPVVGHGTGILIDSRGLILTAKHVAAEARFLAVRIPGSHLVYPADLVYADPNLDFALISIKGSFEHYVALPSVPPVINKGQKIWAYGYPMLAQEQASTVTSGNISNYSTTFGLWQVDAAINKGNSGGPVIDGSGTIIGIVLAKYPDTEGMNYVLPINEVASTYTELSTAGRIVRKDFPWERTEVRIFLAGLIEDLAFDPKGFVEKDFTDKIANFYTSKSENYMSIQEMADLPALLSASIWSKMVASAINEDLTTEAELVKNHWQEFLQTIALAKKAIEIDGTTTRLQFVSEMSDLYDAIKKAIEQGGDSIYKGPTVRLIAPNGGEKLKAGSNQIVEWEPSNESSVTEYKLEYSTDNGEN